jgi:DNA-binding beta-propeller fold protein YncE
VSALVLATVVAIAACSSSTAAPGSSASAPTAPATVIATATTDTAATDPGTTSPDPASAPSTSDATGTSTTQPDAESTTAPSTAPPTTADPDVVYTHTGLGQMSPAVANAKQYVYVPSNDDGSVTVIDQQTMQIVDHYQVGKLVQHVVPDWDLTKLYATASDSNRLVPIDPATGKPGKAIKVEAPYNLYFSPDGATAIVMAERRNRIDVYDRLTWKLLRSIPTGHCQGVNHADWSADLSFFLATCEFSGEILKIDAATDQIIGHITLAKGSMPQDLRLTPEGDKFYVADMQHAGIWVIDGQGNGVIGSFLTGVGAHGIYPSRDGRYLYVSNRGRTHHQMAGRSRPGMGSVSVVDPLTDKVVASWTFPDGGSPDMGGVSADGRRLWLSGRYDSQVYVFDTLSGQLIASIKVPPGPHGLCVFPQPGRYSLGHTGNYR